MEYRSGNRLPQDNGDLYLELRRQRRAYGLGHWRKGKGVARVKLNDGSIRLAELHWYEATGIGRYEFKIKNYLD